LSTHRVGAGARGVGHEPLPHGVDRRRHVVLTAEPRDLAV